MSDNAACLILLTVIFSWIPILSIAKGMSMYHKVKNTHYSVCARCNKEEIDVEPFEWIHEVKLNEED
jgi:hypothetical protein